VRGEGGGYIFGGLSHHASDGSSSVLLPFRESNVGVPGVWVFHVGSAAPLEHVEPGGGGGSNPSVPQTPTHHGSGTAADARALYGHADRASTARHGSEATSPRPDDEPRSPALPGIVPEGVPASPGPERSRRLYPDGDGGARQSYPANPSSYSSGHHGVGVEEDVHFNPDGEWRQPLRRARGDGWVPKKKWPLRSEARLFPSSRSSRGLASLRRSCCPASSSPPNPAAEGLPPPRVRGAEPRPWPAVTPKYAGT